jgi:hypothetical protein
MPHGLEEFNEGVGVLLKVEEQEGFCVASFSWGAISLPLELATKLREMLDKKIAILRLDGYHMAELT